MDTTVKTATISEFEKLFKEHSRAIPKPGDLIEGTIVSVAKNEVLIDLDGYRTGVVRGP
ncbi:30S ribosomal protein S1, partial [Candidatus Uhrbacteria bacterium]|nr:30S ribosomal protein S1 [Candidatus Uhrbacteria bacterium]